MRPRASIFVACVLGALAAVFVLWRAADWRASLRRELRLSASPDGYLSPVESELGAAHFSLPASVARILEGHDRTELLAYLSELRRSTAPSDAIVVDLWTAVVTSGVRGVPATVSRMRGSEVQEVAVYTYAIPFEPRTRPNHALQRTEAGGEVCFVVESVLASLCR